MEWMDTADIFLMGGTIGVDKKHILEGGTPHMICSWGKQLGWGHRQRKEEEKNIYIVARVDGLFLQEILLLCGYIF